MLYRKQSYDATAAGRPGPTRQDQQRPLATVSVLGTFLCAALWGGQAVAVKIAAVGVPPLLMIAGRTALAGVFAFAWATATNHRLRQPPRVMALIGINCLMLYTQMGLFTVGTALTESVRSIVLINCYPVFTAMVCLLFVTGLSVSLRNMAGLMTAITGIFLVFATRFGGWDLSVWQGDLLVLLAAAVMGTQVVYFKSIVKHLHPSQAVFWGSVMACPVFFGLSLVFERPSANLPRPESLWAILYQGVVVSGAAVILWGRLLARHSPNDLNVIRLSSPLFGVLAGWTILGEVLTPSLVLGAALIGLGILLVVRVPGRQAAASRVPRDQRGEIVKVKSAAVPGDSDLTPRI